MNWEKRKDDLEGKVVIYSKYIGEPAEIEFSIDADIKLPKLEIDNGQFLTMYCTTDSLEFMSKTGVTEEIINHFNNEIFDLARQKAIEENRVIKMHALMSIYNSKEEIVSFNPDEILFTGEYSNVSRCMKSVKMGLDYYVMQLVEQMSRKIGFNISDIETKDSKITYNDIHKDSRKQYIMDHYIVPMIDSAITDDAIRFSFTQEQFIDFSSPEHSDITNDALNLCILIKDSGKKQNTELIDAYVCKMVALINEDYDSAAEKRDLINELKNEM